MTNLLPNRQRSVSIAAHLDSNFKKCRLMRRPIFDRLKREMTACGSESGKNGQLGARTRDLLRFDRQSAENS
jgi:hypothetical protein